MTDVGIYAGAAAIGAVAGIRSTAIPEIVEQLTRQGGAAAGDQLGLLSHPVAGYAAMTLAAAEAAADRLPLMPKRADADSLSARAIAGASSGAALCAAKKRAPLLGALLGALGAVAAAYGLSVLHSRTAGAFEIPGPLGSIVADAIAAGAGILLLSKLDAQSQPEAG